MRRALLIALVVLATIAGSIGTLAVVHADRGVGVGSVRLSVEPGQKGALDLYVPVVDWGVRFPAVRFPARLNVDVRSLDRAAITRLASEDGGAQAAVEEVRERATDALASYLRLVLALSVLGGLALGALVALAIRGGSGPRLRVTLAAAGATAIVLTGLLVVTLPPRSGDVKQPVYYANGPEIPAALRALSDVRGSTDTLDDELDDQLVGIARLVRAPGAREDISERPRLTVASDLHNNVLSLPAMERIAGDDPLLFAGDLTDRGSPLETTLVRRVARAGSPFVFVAGNHDSDTLQRTLAREGAIVLTRRGRLRADGSHGRIVNRVGGLRVAGYDDPNMRTKADGYRDHGAEYPADEVQAFSRWLERLRGKVDVVMVHSAALAAVERIRLAADPFETPLLFVVGHSHRAELDRGGPVTALNAGSVGAGGTGNLAEDGIGIGIAALTYATEPAFAPLAADLVQIDPGSGSATAERHRLDVPEGAPGA